MKTKKRKPYSKRSDLEKIKLNWNKIRGLYNRKEWSGLIVRAATALEIAANLVIREELIHNRELESDFVDNLLIWANGLQGKFGKIILPITKNEEYHLVLRSLHKRATEINGERNSIVHRGQFKQKKTADRIIKEAHEIISKMVDIYYEGFELDGIIDD